MRRRNTSIRNQIFDNLVELSETLEALLYAVNSTQESLVHVSSLSSDYVKEFIEPRLRTIRVVSEKVSPLASQTEALLPRQNPEWRRRIPPQESELIRRMDNIYIQWRDTPASLKRQIIQDAKSNGDEDLYRALIKIDRGIPQFKHEIEEDGLPTFRRHHPSFDIFSFIDILEDELI